MRWGEGGRGEELRASKRIERDIQKGVGRKIHEAKRLGGKLQKDRGE